MDDFNTLSGATTTKAQDAYMDALRAIMASNESSAGARLNNARQAVLGNRHWTSLTDADMQTIMPDLTTAKFHGLYGDFHSTSQTPWIRDVELIDMIGRHVFKLGTAEDKQAFQNFKSWSMEIAQAAPAARAA